MTLETVETVDAIGIEDATQHAVLTIADSWDWEDERIHLSALQDKLNAYFEFIESGQIWEFYPTAHGKRIRIDVVFRFAPPRIALEFLAKASGTASKLNVLITHQSFTGTAIKK